MKLLALIVVVVAAAVVGGVTAYFLLSSNKPAQGSPAVAYFCAGYSPYTAAPIQAIQLAEKGQLQNSIAYQGQTFCIGAKLSSSQLQYLKNLTATSYLVGSQNAKVVVIEYLDTTCPYCALFDYQYGALLSQYIQNGTVLYAVRYFPTHTAGFLQENQPQLFAAGVETWLALTCIYNKTGGAAFYTALGSVYEIAARYIIYYLQTGNATVLNIYPYAQLQYVSSQYPQCRVNATAAQLVATAQGAQNDVSAAANALGIPSTMLGTPLFIIYRS
ncbi:MAG: thioredoxin domain-containing protein [Thermoproteus sp.]